VELIRAECSKKGEMEANSKEGEKGSQKGKITVDLKVDNLIVEN